MERQEGEAERSARFEYVKPAIIGALCLPAAMTLAATRSELPVASALGSYLAVYAIAVVAGVGALWLASVLLLGGAGPLGLGILRMAAAMAAFDSIKFLLGANMVAILLAGLALVGLLMWLFEMDAEEAALVAIIIVVLNLLLRLVLTAA